MTPRTKKWRSPRSRTSVERWSIKGSLFKGSSRLITCVVRNKGDQSKNLKSGILFLNCFVRDGKRDSRRARHLSCRTSQRPRRVTARLRRLTVCALYFYFRGSPVNKSKFLSIQFKMNWVFKNKLLDIKHLASSHLGRTVGQNMIWKSRSLLSLE